MLEEKTIKRIGDKLYVKWKSYGKFFNNCIDQNDIFMSYFPDPYDHSKNEIKVELYLFSYATNSNLKSVTGFDTSISAKEVDLASLTSDVDKLDIHKLKNVPCGLDSLKLN